MLHTEAYTPSHIVSHIAGGRKHGSTQTMMAGDVKVESGDGIRDHILERGSFSLPCKVYY